MWHSVASRDDAGKADGSGGPDPSGVDDEDDEDDDEDDDDADEKKKRGKSLLLLLPLLLRRALHLKNESVGLRERKACMIARAISGPRGGRMIRYLIF